MFVFLSVSIFTICCVQIVRDFTLASQADSGLEKMQRSFISTLTSKAFSNGADAVVAAYASSSLGHHLRGALFPPFVDDEVALQVFLHEAPSVVAQALASVRRRDVDDLIEHFLKTESYWPASQLSHAGESSTFYLA